MDPIWNSELVLRSLSVLIGALAVCLTYVVGIELLGRRVAVVGTADCDLPIPHLV